jgi:hypothetical protein
MGCVQEAVHGAVGVVVELNLPNPELVGSARMGTCSDVVDRFLGQLQLRVKVHELRYVLLLQSVANGNAGYAPKWSRGWLRGLARDLVPGTHPCPPASTPYKVRDAIAELTRTDGKRFCPGDQESIGSSNTRRSEAR